MSNIVYIGVDDTDIPGSVGTGRVARGLSNYLCDLGLGISLGVSRHQLLVDDRIHYTSHNSAKAIALKTDKNVTELLEPAIAYLMSCFQSGADPGLCICTDTQVDDKIVRFGKQAITTVLSKQDAIELAAQCKVFLKDLGGTGDGVIGALSAVGLRAWGNEGRLVDLPGIHEIKGLISVADLLASTPIMAVQDSEGKPLDTNEVIDSLDWIRPSLVGGQPVLRVQPKAKHVTSGIWVSIERKHSQTQEKGDLSDTKFSD